jgi:hypothetical protein
MRHAANTGKGYLEICRAAHDAPFAFGRQLECESRRGRCLRVARHPATSGSQNMTALALDPARGVGHIDAMHGPDHGLGRRRRDRRHPGSSRLAALRLIRWGVDRKLPRSPPCRRRRRPKSHLRGRRRSLPVPPSPACRRRESTHGARPARSSTLGMAARLAASPGAGPVLPRPATIRPNLDHPRCALSYPSMSLLDFSEWPFL